MATCERPSSGHRCVVLSDSIVQRLLDAAWEARENARVLGVTKVGAAALSSSGAVSIGCNVEHKFRSHDIHAETNAISSMAATGQHVMVAIAVVAERERFTPCGACLDWIWEFGGEHCMVIIQNTPGGAVEVLSASDLMPHYPR
jgi:cytidine deaminase